MRISSTHRGFSLIEIMVSSTILIFLMAAVFFAFDFGTRAFNESNTKQNAQAEVTKLYMRLRQDLRQTHFRSVSAVPRTFTVTSGDVRRDAVCFTGVRNWKDPASFDEVNGLPKWDRYVLFYGTQQGHLVRTNIDPEYPDFSPAPFDGLNEVEFMSDNPLNNIALQTSYSIISRSLHSFEVELDPSRDMVLVRCLMKQTTGHKVESVELKFDISPQNTWPKADV